MRLTAAHNDPPYTQPAFYELGLFQTPAGNHGECSTGSFSSCAFPPPGHDPKRSSPWSKLCCDGSDCSNCGEIRDGSSHNWTNPETQVRAGLHDIKQEADRIRKDYPDLFHRPGSDWDLRAAVLLRFAGGGGFVRAFLQKYRPQLAALPEDQRWNFLSGKRASVNGKMRLLDASLKNSPGANVQEKMALAAKLGYQPS